MAATTDYFSELEAVGSNTTTTPSPGGSAYHTPRASMSRRPSSRRDVSGTSRGASSSPPPVPTSSPPHISHSSPGTTTHNDDSIVDEDISPLDPRRFTPTLHASLVSEILNLRRELDSKHKFIEDLETSLQTARDEKESVEEQLLQTDKDRRTLKRQFQQLESGTLSALEELAKDRDDAKKSCADLKSKLDDAQDKVKKKEEESDRMHLAWEKEQSAWDTERKAFERRVHITETRLKHVIAELEAVHLAHAELQHHSPQPEDDDNARDSGLGDESDTASQASPMRNSSHRRTMSNSSRRSFGRYRFSVQSVTGPDGQKINGISLADELQLDEEDEEDLESEAGSEVPSEPVVTKKGIVARTSQFFDERAKRMSTASPTRRILQAPIDLESPKPSESQAFLKGLSTPITAQVEYVDTGVQFTPPSSPSLKPTKDVETKGVQTTTIYCDSSVQYEPLEVEDISTPPFGHEHRKDSKVEEQYATELRSQLQTPPLLIDSEQQTSPRSPTKRVSMVSSSSQTVEEPLSPPATPGGSPPASPTQIIQVQLEPPELRSIATQTDFVEEQKVVIPPIQTRPAPIPIPSINIVPPSSAPSSPKEALLPPATKSMGVQTGVDLIATRSVSVQTEEIRIDTRLAKLPPHLQPSFISSNPPTPESKQPRPITVKKRSSVLSSFADRSILRSPTPGDDEIPSSPPEVYAPTTRKSVTVRSSSENLPSAADRVDGLRRLLRSAVGSSSVDSESDRLDRDDSRGTDYLEQEPKVATFSTPNMSARAKHIRIGGTRPSPVPEEKDENEQSPEPAHHHELHIGTAPSGRSSVDTGVSDKGKSIKSNSSKLRRSAMIQSGAAAHRSRTPSIVSVGSSSYFSSKSAGPPFPVPDRGSSRKMFSSRSEGSSSPTPRGGIFSSRRRGTSSTVGRKDSLRKVRSANVIQRSNSGRKSHSRSRSPPLEPRRHSPLYPPLPKDKITVPPKVYPSQKSGEKLLSERPMSIGSKPELARASQGTVVDAIAATMVGEWMWKYVRRRTSFGVPESPQDQMGRPGTDGSMNVTGNGVRHKRWVWLSPYERAIMWSSKQPANNTALMGKTGRKLVIQSVLDVRDDTPLPKNHGIAEPFNRSILILTPARALKFTAMSKERHYTWLTALSFLAHSPLLAPGLASLPPVPAQEAPAPPRSRGNGMKRGGIRDSVRIAKDRARPIKTPRSDHQSGTIPEIEFEAAFGPSNPVPPIPDMPDVAAEPPSIPRFAHGRNRSLTGPKMPSSALRSLGYREVPSPSFPISSLPSPSLDYPSTRVSEASTSTRNNFLDAVGTIRMEAFIDEQNNLNFHGSPLTGVGRRRGNTHSPQPQEGRRGGMVLGDDFDVAGTYDPFKDFGR